MVSVCMYFQVHQPFRLKQDFDFFSIGSSAFYEDDEAVAGILKKVSTNCYLPANELLLKLIKKYSGQFRVAFSFSGVVLDQFERFAPEVLQSFQKLVATGCVEVLSETYYHSLSYLYSKSEFLEEVEEHKQKIKKLFGVNPTCFRNTELIYHDHLAKDIEQMGYKVILAEGAGQLLGWRSPNFVYQPKPCYKLALLLKNYKLSDDIAFRFSNKSWNDYPLTAEKYAGWIHGIAGNGEVINLFLDYETFGEHQKADTGIFEFLESFPMYILKRKDFNFATPSEVVDMYQPVSKIKCDKFVSWADSERDLSAWLGNAMQNSASEYAYSLEQTIKASKDKNLIYAWKKLLSSDHFYYMCTKWFNDGDVHKYFNPYSSPYDAYICYSNVLNHLKETANKLKTSKASKIEPSYEAEV